MSSLKKITRIVLAAAAMCAVLCQTAQAKGVDTNYTQVNGEVAKEARKKYTKLKGKNKDSVTMMVYKQERERDRPDRRLQEMAQLCHFRRQDPAVVDQRERDRTSGRREDKGQHDR